ncbi:hypothetical protein SY88_19335 [Clostridiales bacterium PH28_bin88]|nr:hypothetical protein SY88_19335 [Clostridiales bacterium PH28_bin88]
MFTVLSDPQVVAVFQSIRPFLGPTGQMVTDMAQALGELFASESSQKAYEAFSRVWTGNRAHTMEVRGATPNLAVPFYFLVLYPFLAAAATKAAGPNTSPDHGGNA